LKENKVTIYTLENPITGEIRYVGKTKNVLGHLSKCGNNYV